MRTLTLRLLLCFLLATRVVAGPISYEQIAQQVKQGEQQTETKKTDSQQPVVKIGESGDRPEFVRLADGRIVPYGPGIICTDDCVQSDALALADTPPQLPTRVFRPWLFAFPVVAGVVACIVLCRGGGSSTVITETPPIINPPPPPPPVDIPEPATLVLLGLGLALVARHGFGKRKPPSQ